MYVKLNMYMRCERAIGPLAVNLGGDHLPWCHRASRYRVDASLCLEPHASQRDEFPNLVVDWHHAQILNILRL
jgi:hypothetical protein